MIRSYRENYKNWKELTNTCIPVGIIYDTSCEEYYPVFLNETRYGYAFSYDTENRTAWLDYTTFPTTKDWNKLVESFKQ